MLRFAARIVIAVALIAGAAHAALAEKRVALVIGNGAYVNAPRLPNPVRDAKAVAQALRAAGFSDVTEGYDLAKPQFDAALKRFGDAAAGADWALIFYAGHGIAIGGESFLLPVDVALMRAEHVDDEAVSLARVRAKAGGAKALRLVILDSCRNNPFIARMRAEGGKRAVSRGLARPPEPEGGELIAYATRENDVADDGAGEHSPFTAAFLEHLREPGLEVGFLFRRIRASVLKSTGGAQDPATYGSLSDTPLFFSPLAEPPQSTLSEAARAWSEIKDLKEIAVFEAFKKQYGPSNALYDALAAQKIAELKRAQVAVVTPPKPVVSDAPCKGLLVSVATGARPCIKPGSGESFRDCPDCPEMVIAPSGSFTMGSPKDEPERSDGEGPQHKVTIAKPFAVGKFAVMFAEWDACVAAGGCNTYKPGDQGWGRGGRPVINVSWDDATAYVAWMNSKVKGQPYRLLTEAEREYVTRAGSTTPFWWGSSITPDQANYDGNYTYAGGGKKGEYRQNTLPAKFFKPNPWGLYQVHGNVYDWVENCWVDSYKGAPADSSAITAEDCALRVLRGGSWDDDPAVLRSAFRIRYSPDYRVSNVGFRLARTLD
jgi:formylglycine-generating enzyme required for sulfatase activity